MDLPLLLERIFLPGRAEERARAEADRDRACAICGIDPQELEGDAISLAAGVAASTETPLPADILRMIPVDARMPRGEAAMGAILAILVVFCSLATAGSGCGSRPAHANVRVLQRAPDGPWWQAEHARLLADVGRYSE